MWCARAIAACVIHSAIWTGAAWAEPGPVGRWLMNQPVSLFSLGLYKVEKDIERAAEQVKYSHARESLASGGARYEWDDNRIVLYGRFIMQAVSNKDGQRICKAFIDEVRYFGGVNPDTGQLNSQGLSSWYALEFDHIGYGVQGPADWRTKLDRIFVIEVEIMGVEGLFRCHAPLLGSTFSIQQ